MLAGKICGRKGLWRDFLRSGAASGVPAGSGSNEWCKSLGQNGKSNIRVGIFFVGGVVASRSDVQSGNADRVAAGGKLPKVDYKEILTPEQFEVFSRLRE